jgi:hypothetical protein
MADNPMTALTTSKPCFGMVGLKAEIQQRPIENNDAATILNISSGLHIWHGPLIASTASAWS